MRRQTINLLLLITCLVLLFVTLIPLFLGYYLAPRITQNILKKEIEEFFQKKAEVGRSGLTILGGFGIEYRDVRVPGPDGKDFFRVSRFRLQPSIRSLILGRLRWKRIVLRNPSIRLVRTSKGKITPEGKGREECKTGEKDPCGKLLAAVSHLPSQLSIQGGRILFTDHALAGKAFVTEVENIEATSQRISQGKALSLHIKGRVAGGRREEFSISTRISGIEEPLDIHRLGFAVSFQARAIDLRRMWPYLRRVVPFETMKGLLDLKLEWKGRPESFQSSGEVKIRSCRFTLPALYTAPIRLKEGSLRYDLEYKQQVAHISRLVLKVPHISVSGAGSISKSRRGAPAVSLVFTTKKTPLRALRPYLPDLLIPRRVLGLLKDRRFRGSFRLEKVKLDGVWTDLAPGTIRKRPGTLSLRLKVSGASVPVDSKLPPLRDVSGLITLRRDRLGLSGFHGRFRQSRLTLDGSVSRLYSDPAMAVAFKGDLDLKGLLPLLKGEAMPQEVRKALQPIAAIHGRARIEGKIRHRFSRFSDLAYQTRISLKGARLRISGIPSPLTHMEGEIRCTEKEILFSRFKWRMGGAPCHGHASVRGYVKRFHDRVTVSRGMRISLDMGSEELKVDELLPKGGGGKIRIDPDSIWLNSTVTAKMSIARGSLGGLHFANFITAFTLKRGLLRFRRFQAEIPGGFIRSGGWVRLKSGGGISFKVTPTIHRMDLAGAVPSPKGRRSFLSGRLNLEGVLVGRGDSAEGIVRSLAGDLRLMAEDGSLHGLRGHPDQSIPYNRVTGRILIEKGIASTRDLYLDGDVVSMTLGGWVDLNGRSLDLRIGVRPLQTMDRILSNVPVAGWLLAGKDRSILTFCYRLRGRFNDFELKSISPQNAGPGSH
ncbi:MAG: AsmA-like C-terminal domain-containing protein [Deltaproteobacteria bacterium]|nr:AsmA-like C-terminal domain-containing protein [Deltaproteobacteria bacterium]